MSDKKTELQNDVQSGEILENNFSEELSNLVDSEATLSEGFKEKASVIFEAALNAKIKEKAESLEEEYKEKLEAEVVEIEEALVGKINDYLDYVVESWMKENEVAIETGLRADIAESFIKNLHAVFAEHYVEVPESKVDLVDELSTKVADLEESLNAETSKNLQLVQENKKFAKDKILSEASEGLSVAQAEKLKSLAENVDFTNVESYKAKVETLKESFAKKDNVQLDTDVEQLDESATEKEVSVAMSAYLQALKS